MAISQTSLKECPECDGGGRASWHLNLCDPRHLDLHSCPACGCFPVPLIPPPIPVWFLRMVAHNSCLVCGSFEPRASMYPGEVDGEEGLLCESCVNRSVPEHVEP